MIDLELQIAFKGNKLEIAKKKDNTSGLSADLTRLKISFWTKSFETLKKNFEYIPL